ncbi:hypothetical protein B4U80_13521 [Leptotrombidium deliense]|uniref:Mitochondrial import receptor subunit TOM70-like protein n=1 Tax=Leptotrombidium deliense TaxID=299467 RepID=A0A443S5A6_9ACAR|nr:hypothetical protein B4U80_13521 [Leptotrombidium deliense]
MVIERIRIVNEAKVKAKECFEREDYVTAIDWYRKAISNLPNKRDELIDLYIRCASAYEKFRDYENVIAYCNVVLCLKPDCVDALKLRANSLSKKGFFEAASKDKNCIEELDKINKPVTKKKQKREEFVKSIDKAVSANEIGERFFNLNNFAIAINYYSQAINYCGNNDNYFSAKFHYNRAVAHQKLNDLRNFHKDCVAAIELDKTYKKVYRRRGKLLWKLGDWKQAINDFITVCAIENYKEKVSIDTLEKAIFDYCEKTTDDIFLSQCGPSNNIEYANRKFFREFFRHPFYDLFKIRNSLNSDSLSVSQLLCFYYFLKENSDILSDNAKCESDLLKSNFIILKATLNILTKQYSTAETQLEEVIDMYEKNPDFSTVHRDTVTYAFICLGNIKGRRLIKDGYGIDFAMKCFDRALMNDNKNEDVYYHRAMLYVERGQVKNARNDLEKSIEYGTDFLAAKCKYLRLKFDLAFNAKNQNALNSVIAEFDELANEFRDSCVVFSNYAEVLTLVGKFEEAQKKLKIAIELDKRDPDLYLQMGKILFKASKKINQLTDWCFKALEADCRCIVAMEILALLLINICAIPDAFYLLSLATSFFQDKKQTKNLHSLVKASIGWAECARYTLCYSVNEYTVAFQLFRAYFFEEFAPKYISLHAKEIIGDMTEFIVYGICSPLDNERLISKVKELLKDTDAWKNVSTPTIPEIERKCWGINNIICFTCQHRKDDLVWGSIFE